VTGLVTFFAREGRLLVAESDQTTSGFFVHGRAWDLGAHPPEALIGASVRRGVRSCRQVPDPPRGSRSMSGPPTRVAGVRSWKAFTAPGSRSAHVLELKGVISVTPTKWAKGGFAHQADLRVNLPGGIDDISDEDLDAALLAALAVRVG
jgi:hypothetical protein